MKVCVGHITKKNGNKNIFVYLYYATVVCGGWPYNLSTNGIC